MIVTYSSRDFEWIERESYPDKETMPLVRASSAIGNYENSFDNPGSSFLWVGKDFHLNREEVAELIQHMQAWLDTGSLVVEEIER